MKIYFLVILGTVSLFITSISKAACIFNGYEAEYQFTAGSIHGTVSQKLTFTPNHHYQFTAYTSAKWMFFHDLITEKSIGIIKNKNFLPQHYVLKDSRTNQTFILHFDKSDKKLY